MLIKPIVVFLKRPKYESLLMKHFFERKNTRGSFQRKNTRGSFQRKNTRGSFRYWVQYVYMNI